MKFRVQLETLSDVKRFIDKSEKLDAKIFLSDDSGLKVSAKSLMGVIYTLEFSQIWLESDKDVYSIFAEFAY